MKHKLLYILPFVIALGSCVKKSTPTPVLTPTGTFTGTFTRLHQNPKTSKIDTLKANLQLALTSNNNFVITGDTSTVHAGSYGTYGFSSIYSNLIQFIDKTAPTTGISVKSHLNGVYQYYYDGSVFQLSASNDTLAYLYNLKKVVSQ